MKWNISKSRMDTIQYGLSIFCAITILAGFLIPEYYVFFHLKPFTWQNAWDKSTYYSYQGMEASLALFGYAWAYVVDYLQKLGIAGSTQALLADSLLPLFTIFFTYKALRITIADSKNVALSYALLILFSSILFTYGNHFIFPYLGPPELFPFFLVGWETYPSILRGPQPQLSYFFIALSVFLTVKFKRSLFLLLPIPFLYFFVIMPYLYLVAVALYFRQVGTRVTIPKTIIMNLAIFIALSLLIWFFSWYKKSTIDLIQSGLYQSGHAFRVNLVGCLGLALYFILKIVLRHSLDKKIEALFLSLIFCSFAITNFQVINGFALALKNYQDYGNGIIGGMLLALTHRALAISKLANENLKKYLIVTAFLMKYVIVGLIIYLIWNSQGFNFKRFQFRITVGAQISAEQFEQIKKDPLRAIVLDDTLSHFLPFSVPSMLAPVFSYHYFYPFIEKRCEYNHLLAINAKKYLEANYCADNANEKDCGELRKRMDGYFKSYSAIKSSSYKNAAYCNYNLYAKTEFFIIKPTDKNAEIVFPKWRKVFYL